MSNEKHETLSPRKRHPLLWVPTAYFAMGLPFVVINMVAVLMYKDLGMDEKIITFWTGLLLLPWTLKPLWSPFMELYKTKRFFVIATQIITGTAFGLVALSMHLPHFFAITIACMAVAAFSGATHDIACDGIYINALDKAEQSAWIGWQGAFYNLAKLFATGGLVWLAGYLSQHYITTRHFSVHAADLRSWTIIFSCFALVLIGLGLLHTITLPKDRRPHPEQEKRTAKVVATELKQMLKEFCQKRHIVYFIFFIILYRFAEGFVVKMVPLFLKASRAEGGLGLSNENIGLYYGTIGSLLFVVGSILGGTVVSKFGLRRSLFPLCLVFNIPFAVYALLAYFMPTQHLYILGGIGLEYFGYGFGFVGLTLFMMQEVAPGKYNMAYYAFASGIMNLGVMLPGMLSGWVWEICGSYHTFFWIVLLATLPSLLITYFVPFVHSK